MHNHVIYLNSKSSEEKQNKKENEMEKEMESCFFDY